MAAYDYYCDKCETIFEVHSPISKHKRVHVCPKCGHTKAMQYFGTPITVQKPMEPYFDHGLNRFITSWDHRRNVMKERDVEEIGNDGSFMDDKRELLAQCRDRQKQGM